MRLRAPRHHALQPWIASIWVSESARSQREHAIPAGTMQLAIRVDGPPLRLYSDERDLSGRELSRAVIGGAYGDYYIKQTAVGRTVGAQLKPGATWALFGISAAQLAQRHTPIQSFWGEAMGRLHQRLASTAATDDQIELMEQALLAHLLPIRA